MEMARQRSVQGVCDRLLTGVLHWIVNCIIEPSVRTEDLQKSVDFGERSQNCEKK